MRVGSSVVNEIAVGKFTIKRGIYNNCFCHLAPARWYGCATSSAAIWPRLYSPWLSEIVAKDSLMVETRGGSGQTAREMINWDVQFHDSEAKPNYNPEGQTIGIPSLGVVNATIKYSKRANIIGIMGVPALEGTFNNQSEYDGVSIGFGNDIFLNTNGFEGVEIKMNNFNPSGDNYTISYQLFAGRNELDDPITVTSYGIPSVRVFLTSDNGVQIQIAGSHPSTHSDTIFVNNLYHPPLKDGKSPVLYNFTSLHANKRIGDYSQIYGNIYDLAYLTLDTI